MLIQDIKNKLLHKETLVAYFLKLKKKFPRGR